MVSPAFKTCHTSVVTSKQGEKVTYLLFIHVKQNGAQTVLNSCVFCYSLFLLKDHSKISTCTTTPWPRAGSRWIKILALYWQRKKIVTSLIHDIMITFSHLFYLLFTHWEFADLGRRCKWIVSEVSVVETCSKLAQEFLPSTSSFHIQHV